METSLVLPEKEVELLTSVPSGGGLLAGIVKMTLKASQHFDQACGLEMPPTFAGIDFDDEGTTVWFCVATASC